ncbi:hypothetical protein MKX03_019853 [Papaver bracteatum]|nr:hypothetical protein MKX03_019853 [Papaver bracteatum]
MVHMHASLHFYSLKVNSWKTIADALYVIPSKKLVFYKGFFHWLGYTGLQEMGCFDTANETVKHILLPQHFWHKFNEAQVCVLGGWLCVVGNHFEKNISEVWTMKDYGVADSWTKMFNVGQMKQSGLPYLDLKQPFKNDAILVHHGKNSTYLFDLNHEVAKKLKIDRILPAPRSQTWDFIGSLIRLI